MLKYFRAVYAYFTQRNNALNPGSACFPTSLAQALVANGIKEVSPILHNLCKDDAVYAWANTPDVGGRFAKEMGASPNIPPHQWWSVMQRLADWYIAGGTDPAPSAPRYAKWIEGATFAQIKTEIDNGYGVVLGTLLTHSGHVVFCSGYTPDGRLIISDPWGNPNTNYRDTANGHNVVLDTHLMPRVAYLPGGKYRILLVHADKRIPV